MKIYHYTSIETLALIVYNKNIRFNRLDFVDDWSNYHKVGTIYIRVMLDKRFKRKLVIVENVHKQQRGENWT